MADRFGASAIIDRPIDEVFAFLADGENDKKFSPRIIEISKTTDGPPGAGTVYASTAKDGGITAKHEFELTEFEAPGKIRWKELSKAPRRRGQRRLRPRPRPLRGTELTFFNELEGRGFGKLIAGFALRAARKGADDFANCDQAGGRGELSRGHEAFDVGGVGVERRPSPSWRCGRAARSSPCRG